MLPYVGKQSFSTPLALYIHLSFALGWTLSNTSTRGRCSKQDPEKDTERVYEKDKRGDDGGEGCRQLARHCPRRLFSQRCRNHSFKETDRKHGPSERRKPGLDEPLRSTWRGERLLHKYIKRADCCTSESISCASRCHALPLTCGVQTSHAAAERSFQPRLFGNFSRLVQGHADVWQLIYEQISPPQCGINRDFYLILCWGSVLSQVFFFFFFRFMLLGRVLEVIGSLYRCHRYFGNISCLLMI